jgi:cytochrome b pre-mRNA-processing protein 3
VVAGFLSKHAKLERAAFKIYGAAVTAARDPFLYATLGVPDTLDGRFDAIGLYVYLTIRRLSDAPPPGPALAQAVFDAMFLDMDVNLREMGVGDMSVGKRNRTMWEAFHGRSAAYTSAWEDGYALEESLTRNLWRGADAPMGAASALRRVARAQATCLVEQGIEAMLRGDIAFLPAAEAAR